MKKKKQLSHSRDRGHRNFVNNDKKAPLTLIRTKLHRPPVPHDWVKRPQLLELLNQGFHRPITLVCAPAGYGKSCLVSDCLEECDSPGAWLSLDKNDNDLRLFVVYFLAAIQKMFSAVGRTTLALVNSVNLPPFSKLAASLINELSGIGQPFVLVLDDYHNVQEKLVHDLLIELLRHPPTSMHLVLISRHDPLLPLATYRAQGRLIEIGAPELCFTEQETGTFLSQVFNLEVDPSTAATWQEKTEGWVTGLRLAVLAISHLAYQKPFLPKLQGDNLTSRDYLFNEVLSRQPSETRQKLMSTAILDSFCASLCDAVGTPGVEPVADDMGGWDFITQLKRQNLFVIPLDRENQWFRYHHLFQQLLLNQLKRHHSAGEIRGLHRRASDWFAKHALTEEALLHALAAGDTKRTAELIAQAGFQLMDSQEWPLLQRWLHMLPHADIEQSPELLILQAWIYHIQTNLPDMDVCLQKVEALKATSQPNILTSIKTIQGHYEALCGYQCYMKTDGEQALALTQSACEKIPDHHKRARVFAHIFRLGSHQIVGDLETGLSMYKEVMMDSSLIEGGYQYMFMINLCFVYWIDADLISLRQTAECLLSADQSNLLPETAAMGNYFLGIAHFCLNDLDSAEEKLSRVIDEFYTCHTLIFACTSFALALVYQARGEPEKARKSSEAVVTYAIETSNRTIFQFAQAFTAELALRQGRLAEASQWAKRFRAKPFLPTYLFYMPQLTLIKTLLAQDTMDSRQQAADLLDELHAFQVSIHNKVFLIDVLVLQSLLHDAREEEQAALDKLKEAVVLAEPGGFIRLFVEMGPRMAYLLTRLIRQNTALEYIGRILAAFRGDDTGMVQGLKDDQAVRLSSLSPQPFLDPLTRREIEILDLLAKRLHNKEIADKLFISNETVKSHLSSIYQKLNVNGRQQAVEKACVLCILSSR